MRQAGKAGGAGGISEVDEAGGMDRVDGRSGAGDRIGVAMSGGVDSAVAAALLREQGYEVVGMNMRVWQREGPRYGEREERPAEAETTNGTLKFERRTARQAEGRIDDKLKWERHTLRTCCSPYDVADARAVAERLGIAFYALDVEREFEEAVVRPFVAEYLRGRTPNPCVRCNQMMKLGVLLEKARQYGCAAVATGHYVRIERSESGRWGLRRAADRLRDQSYYLFSLSQEQLAHFAAPLGGMTKEAVRRIAARLELPVAEKPGSQEICFIPDGDYRGFVRRHPLGHTAAIEPGEIVDCSGRVLGRHEGMINFTVGQRRGLRIAHRAPLYVVALDAASNRVIVGGKSEVFARGLIARGTNWMAIERLEKPMAGRVQIRYRHEAMPAWIEPLEGDGVRIVFETPQPAVAPGQAAVVYDESDEYVIGGGWIEESVR